MAETITKFKKGVEEIYPTHPMVANWVFQEGENAEAELAGAMAWVAEKNGLASNDLHHLFPAVLRMLRSDVLWAGQKDSK